MAYRAYRGPTARPSGQTGTARSAPDFVLGRRLAAHGMERSWPYVRRQHFEVADWLESLGVVRGSNHHRYGEVKTRLTIGASAQLIERRPKRGAPCPF